MKLNKKIIIVFLLGFILLNIFSIKNFFYSTYAKLLESKGEYKKVEEISKKQNSFIGKYNLGVSLYKQKKYTKALLVFLSIFDPRKQNFDLDYNIGNSYYKVGTLEKDSKKKIGDWIKAISYYEKSLDIRYDDKTKKNIEFILRKIKQERKKQEQKNNQENKKNNNQKGQKDNSKKSNNSGTGSNDSSNKKQNSKKSENKNSDSKENNSSKQGNSNKNKENDKKGSSNNNLDNKEKKSSNNSQKGEDNNSEQKGGKNNTKENSQGNKNNTENNKKGDNQQKVINQEQNQQTKGSSNKSGLSQHDKQLLKAYQNRVAQSSQNLGDYYGKVYKQQSNPFDGFDNFFGGDPFFNNDDFGNNQNKKDW